MHAPNNPFECRSSSKRAAEHAVLWSLRGATYFILLVSSVIFLWIGFKGVQTVVTTRPPFINVAFLTERPSTLYTFQWQGKLMELSDAQFRKFKQDNHADDIPAESHAYAAGGIWPCIVGTVLLVTGSMIIALFLGICSAIFLSEYNRSGPLMNMLRLSIMNLAGVPSIVFGLFGVALFVVWFHWGQSLLAGWFTLAFMVLPVIITASEEALKAVPQGLREASLALGATKWQTIWTNVLPYALPGILTSSVLGIARVAGETAPIMYTAAFSMRDKYPWEVDHWTDFFFQGVMALPYHIYVVSSKIPQDQYAERVQYGTAFVFLVVVMSIALASILMRNRLRQRYKW